jgi:hypothetical protein
MCGTPHTSTPGASWNFELTDQPAVTPGAAGMGRHRAAWSEIFDAADADQPSKKRRLRKLHTNKELAS